MYQMIEQEESLQLLKPQVVGTDFTFHRCTGVNFSLINLISVNSGPPLPSPSPGLLLNSGGFKKCQVIRKCGKAFLILCCQITEVTCVSFVACPQPQDSFGSDV